MTCSTDDLVNRNEYARDKEDIPLTFSKSHDILMPKNKASIKGSDDLKMDTFRVLTNEEAHSKEHEQEDHNKSG